MNFRLLSAPVLLLACVAACSSTSSDEQAGVPVSDGGGSTTVDGASPDGAATATPDGGVSLDAGADVRATGRLVSSGTIGGPGETPVPFSFDQQVGPRVIQRVGPECGEVSIVYGTLGEIRVTVMACSPSETLVARFVVPIAQGKVPRVGSFPKNDPLSPRATVDLYRGAPGMPFRDKDPSGYYSSPGVDPNPTIELTVSNVVAAAGKSSFDLKLSGAFRRVSATPCSTCTVGGDALTLDLSLSFIDAPAS